MSRREQSWANPLTKRGANGSDSRSQAESFLASPRKRLRVALLLSMSVAAILAFVLFPARRVTVTADGPSVEVTSRETDTATILSLAGVPAQLGDVVEHSDEGVVVDRAISVRVNVDGQTLAWRTRSNTVEDLIEEMGLRVSPYDRIVYNGVVVPLPEQLVPEEQITLSITRAVAINVDVDGHSRTLNTSHSTLADALAEAGITLGPADLITLRPQSDFVAGMTVEIQHAKAINLQTGDGTYVLYTHALHARAIVARSPSGNRPPSRRRRPRGTHRKHSG